MRAEILIVPTPASLEMLKKSAQALAKNLVENGITVHEEISLCPDRKRLQHAISQSLKNNDVLFTVGGMGRDSQFLAKTVMCEGLGLALEHSNETMVAIKDYINRSGLMFSPDDATLASLPAGSRPIFPTKGIIPGCIVSSSTQHIVMMPENAEEILPMMKKQVLPYLKKTGGLTSESSHEIRTYGVSEEQVRRLISDLMGTTNPIVTTRLQDGEVVVKVASSAKNSNEASSLASPVLRTIVGRLGDHAYGLDVDSLEQAVIQKMQSKGYSLSIAESGTNGTLINKLNTTAGNHILGQILTPEDAESKAVQLGLNARHIKRRGDVSEFTAVQMADAVRELGNTDLGVAVTADIPGMNQGGEALIYIAVCNDEDVYVKKLVVQQKNMDEYRNTVNAVVSRALNMIRIFVDYLPEPYSGSVPLDKALAGKVTVTDKDNYTDEFEYQDDFEDQYIDEETPKNKRNNKRKKKAKRERSYKSEESSIGKGKKIVLIVAVLVFLAGAGYLGWYGVNSLIAHSLRGNTAEVYDKAGLAGLKSLNSDTVGFVELEGTDLRYPVVQSSDNDYYLRRNFNKKDNWHGVPFADYKHDTKKPSDNVVIYGHNLRDGQMFSELLNYWQLDYYKEHPIVKFDSGGKESDYKIFSILLTSNDTSHFDNGKIFNYHEFVNASSDDEYDAFVKQLRVRSIINIPVDVKAGDDMIMLSTCDNDVLRDSRFVIVARKIRNNENRSVDTEKAEKNSQTLYPDIWYKTYSGYTKPDVENWEYSAPKQAATTSSKEESSREPSSNTESSSREDSSSESSKVESSSENAASKAAEEAKKAEESKAAQSTAAASKAAEDAKKAEESKAAESADASKAAEESKKAEESKAAESSAEQENAKQDAEDTAITEAGTAQDAAQDAASYQRSALNAQDKKAAERFADSAKAAANSAETAASSAEAAAETAGTQRAKEAATSARASAKEARSSADAAVQSSKNKADGGDVLDTAGAVNIRSYSSFDEDDTLDIVARIVQLEMGSNFHTEALKAQAVASYTFIKQANLSGTSPDMAMASSADSKVRNAVAEVLGEAVYYNGNYAFTPYHSTSAGKTTDSSSVWGGSYPYLVSVDSSVDKSVKGYISTTKLSSDKVSQMVEQKLGIETYGEPSTWFSIESKEQGGYNGKITICGESRNSSGSAITGRTLREQVFSLKSAAFDIAYDSSADSFTFTTYGYGHGVGLSQNGANAYANQGWSYEKILEHYYSGATVG